MPKFFSFDGFKAALPWLTILLGIITLWYGHFTDFQNTNVQKFTTDLGKTALAGGLFAVLLKTYQFMGIFKDELSKVVWDAKYLNNRKDLSEVWVDVSKIMFKNKFAGINNEITRDVKNIYFPTEQVSYFDNYKQIITIELIDANERMVKVTQQSEYTIYPNDASSKLKLSFNNSICFNEKPEEVSFKLVSFKINGSDFTKFKPNTFIDGVHLHNKISWEASGSPHYRVETEIEKTYCLDHDDIISFCKTSLIHDFNLKIIAKGVKITFLSRGTLQEFEKIRVKADHFSEYVYKGIIYPKQGYTIFIRS